MIGLLLLAVVISVGLIVKELTNNNEFLTKRVRELNSKIDEKTVNEKSLLKLMEAHKRNAYTEILRYLERLTILISMRHEWENNGARLVKMLIKPYSTAEQLDPEYAKRERIDCVVNVGSCTMKSVKVWNLLYKTQPLTTLTESYLCVKLTLKVQPAA